MIKRFIGNKGPKIAIMGALHGNEPTGALIIQKLNKVLKKEQINGEIILVIGNPKAYKAKKRFIDTDLNRIFHLNFEKPYNTEEKRALEIAPILKKVDYLLDIHCTQKPSTAFVYCKNSPKHLQLAEIFECDYIVNPTKKFKLDVKSVSSDDFVDKNGGIGITYETGWNMDLSTLDKAFQKTKEFLSYLKIAFMDETPKKSKSILLSVQEYLIPKNTNFKLARDYNNFDLVKSGKNIAKEGNKGIKRPYDAYILFPKKEIIINKPAVYLAKKYD